MSISNEEVVVANEVDGETEVDNTPSNEPINEMPSENISETEKNNEDESSGDTQWTEGEILKFVRVRFPGNAKSFPFLLGKKPFAYGQKVVAMSDRGMDVGYINSFPYELPFKKHMLPIRTISKVATKEDEWEQREHTRKSKEAESVCNEIIEQFKLNMTITHVEITQFGKKMVFYFTAPARVDFRDLVKNLVTKLKMRIELRQISVRDRTAALGSIASCGLPTCCSSFLQSYGHVSVKMAKNQNLAMIPSKINGVCGQIKCCVKFENHVYTEKRKKLPPESMLLTAANGDRGKVTKLHLFIEQFDMITVDGKIRRYSANQFDGDTSKKAEWSLPRQFDMIVNETQNVIGIELIDPTPILPTMNTTPLEINKPTPAEQTPPDNGRASSEQDQTKKDERANNPKRRPRNNRNKRRPNNAPDDRKKN